MSVTANLAVLRERLGDEGTACLIGLLESTRQEVKEEVMTSSTDRFERRLAEECGAMRNEMTRGFAKVEVTLVRWMFAFWVGQAVALVGVVLTYLKVAAG